MQSDYTSQAAFTQPTLSRRQGRQQSRDLPCQIFIIAAKRTVPKTAVIAKKERRTWTFQRACGLRGLRQGYNCVDETDFASSCDIKLRVAAVL
jgi:hypothetical protein